MNFHEEQISLIKPKPVTNEYLNDIFIYREMPDGGMIGYFPFRTRRNSPQNGGNEADAVEQKEK